jgi:hypothetical protein
MGWCSDGDKLDQEIFDAMTEFIAALMQRGDQLSQRYDVPVSAIKALRRLDTPVSMKDLGQRRVKNLVLTDRGLEVKAAMEQETLGLMPWTQALDRGEREQFLELLRKMCKALAAAPVSPAVGQPEREVNSATGLTSSVAP